MLGQHLILAGLWILYGFFHSFLAAEGVKQWAQKRMGPSFKHYRLLYTLFAAITLAGILFYQFGMQTTRLWTTTTFSFIAGLAIALPGVVIMGICIRKYFMNLSGVKSLVEEETKPELIISGIHRFLRHPLYLGTFAFIWGLSICFPLLSAFISNTVITLYTVLAIPLEERKLVSIFGEQYRAYQATVPMILPFKRVRK